MTIIKSVTPNLIFFQQCFYSTVFLTCVYVI